MTGSRKKSVEMLDLSALSRSESDAHLRPVMTFQEVVELASQRYKKQKMAADLTLYLVFLVTFLFAVFLTRDVSQAFLLKRTYEDVFIRREYPPEFSTIRKDFSDIESVEEFWQWAQGPLTMAVNEALQNDGYLSRYNRFIGRIRFRQVRVKNDSCNIYSNYDQVIDGCYAEYGQSTKDTAPYGPGLKFVYKTQSQLKSTGDVGRLVFNRFYDGAGYAVDVPVDANFTSSLQELIDDRWIDVQTRAVFVTVNMMNANLLHHTLLKMVVEISPGGGVYSWFKFLTYKIDEYITHLDRFVAFLQASIFFFLLYFVYAEWCELREIWKTQKTVKPYFMNPWNLLDICNLIIFFAVGFMIIYYLTDPDRTGADVMTTEYFGLDGVAQFYTTVFDITSFNILLSVFKVFKFMKISPRLTILWDMLGKASPDLFAYFFFFSIVFIGFASMGHLLFGPDIFGWRDFFGALSVCAQMINGNIDYQALHAVHRFFGPLFYLVFMVLVYFTLANMFLAIMNDSYTTLRSEPIQSENLFVALKDGVQKQWRWFVRKVKRDPSLTFTQMLSKLKSELKDDEIVTLERIRDVFGKTISEEDAERLYSILVPLGPQIQGHANEATDLNGTMDLGSTAVSQFSSFTSAAPIMQEQIPRPHKSAASLIPAVSLLKRKMQGKSRMDGDTVRKLEKQVDDLEEIINFLGMCVDKGLASSPQSRTNSMSSPDNYRFSSSNRERRSSTIPSTIVEAGREDSQPRGNADTHPTSHPDIDV
eukprot:TRINITY_DN6860_c0_g1_i1.p1 TRINITY_DN6860_c0_g1~~TRINITY_DN6860_c0_g1_i1.p1  ORF type:complete len:759 (+),score=130.64 TRINITY_DN6860_c0_g1_i1:53-2329(+)